MFILGNQANNLLAYTIRFLSDKQKLSTGCFVLYCHLIGYQHLINNKS